MAGPPIAIAGFGANAVQNVCAILQPLLNICPDPLGNPFTPTVTVASSFPDEDQSFPRIAVSAILGTDIIMPGDNHAYDDRDANLAWFNCEATDSRVVLEIEALSDSDRKHLASYLRWGIRTAYSVDPDTNFVRNGAILAQFDDAGIIPKAFLTDQYPAPKNADQREYGQVYKAIVTLQADIACSWSISLTNPTSVGIQITATPTLYLPSMPVASVTEATITVP